jgi:threonine dehydrogenase-like Zn-dependent dehydrogenase
VPATALHRLPDTVDDTLGALVEPGGNALRAAEAANLNAGDSLLVLGPGTIGLLIALFARAAGAEVHLLGLPGPSLDFAAADNSAPSRVDGEKHEGGEQYEVHCALQSRCPAGNDGECGDNHGESEQHHLSGV